MVMQHINTKANTKASGKNNADKCVVNTMKKGYLEMADINLSLSKLYFEAESEVETYYDRITECE
ncbi:MAG: hypothetical protein ACRDDX_01785 [Cellulosilyticaceae bacterium]